MNWRFTQTVKKLPKMHNTVLIEGLPGIGNVGKVVVDFMVDNLKARKIFDVFSYTFPHSVFVNEQHLVELPRIELYHAKVKQHDLLFLAGDIQPLDEVSCYEFCDKLIELMKKLGGKEVITIGGIGLNKIPKHPKIYCTATSKKVMQKCNGWNLEKKIYGVVGPIVGVTGILTGLAGKHRMDGLCLLAETFGHPMYLGVSGAREILKMMDKHFKIGLDLKRLDTEIKELESELLQKTSKLENIKKRSALKKLSGKFEKDLNYIG